MKESPRPCVLHAFPEGLKMFLTPGLRDAHWKSDVGKHSFRLDTLHFFFQLQHHGSFHLHPFHCISEQDYYGEIISWV